MRTFWSKDSSLGRTCSISTATFLKSTAKANKSSLCEVEKYISWYEWTQLMKENQVFHNLNISCVTKYAPIKELGSLESRSLLHCWRKYALASWYDESSDIDIEKYISNWKRDKILFLCFLWCFVLCFCISFIRCVRCSRL